MTFYKGGDNGRRGKKLSAEHIEKLRLSHLGQRHSSESRQRMKDSWLERRRKKFNTK